MRIVDKSIGLVIGVPSVGRPTPPHWGLSFASLRPPINYNVRTGFEFGKEVADARNSLAEQAISMNARYLFFIGDDVTVPGHTLPQLIYRAEHNPNLGVVSGIYVAKRDPAFPLVFRGNGAGSYWGWKVGEFFEVTGVGMDVTLIRVEALKAMKPPWFKTIHADGHLDGEARIESWTEDLWFCNKLIEETDYEVWADSMVMCEHWEYLGGNSWNAWTLRKDSLPMQRDPLQNDFQILDLGCGPVHHDFGSEGQVTRCDIREECEPDYRIDIRQLPFEKESYDVVFSSHTLEHFGRLELKEVLDEWLRVLKPGGELRLVLPNILWAARRLVETDGETDVHVMNVLYGSQEYTTNFHRNGFTPKRIALALTDAGLEEVEVAEVADTYNMVITARKPVPEIRPEDEGWREQSWS